MRASLEPPRTEPNELDWKLTLTENKTRLSEHLCAFANYSGGGHLVFGIHSSGTPETIEEAAANSIVTQVTNLGRAAIEPPAQIDHACEEYDGNRLLFIRIPESPEKPVHIRGGSIDKTFIRSGGSTRAASRQDVAALLLNSKTPTWEELNASLLLSDLELIAMLDLGPIFKMLDRPKPETQEALLEWLSAEKFINRIPTGGGYITNLGAIAAADAIEKFETLSRKAIRVIHYQGLNKTITVEEVSGRRGYAIGFQGLLTFIMRLLPKSEIIEAALRTSRPIYPEIALRELIANALIHQDFLISGTGPMIEIYDDRIEITNPGTLLPSKQTDKLIGTQGESRNEKLARAFRRYRICEERGSGLLKAALDCEVFGLPPIAFTNGTNFFKVTLFSPRTFAEMTERERLDACYQHAVLKYYSSSTMTNKSLRERLRMPEKHRSMVSVLIQKAVEQKRIKPADPDNASLRFTEYLPYWA